jgi:hypothetical protein
MVNYQHLYSSAFQKILQNTTNNEILNIITYAGNAGPKRNYSALWDYGPHELSMIYALSRSELILSSATNIYSINGSNHSFILNMNGENFSSSKIWNDSLPKTRYIEVNTKKMKLVYDDILINDKLIINGKSIELDINPPLSNSLGIFLSAINNNIELKNHHGYIPIDNLKIIKKLSNIQNFSLV